MFWELKIENWIGFKREWKWSNWEVTGVAHPLTVNLETISLDHRNVSHSARARYLPRSTMASPRRFTPLVAVKSSELIWNLIVPSFSIGLSELMVALVLRGVKTLVVTPKEINLTLIEKKHKELKIYWAKRKMTDIMKSISISNWRMCYGLVDHIGDIITNPKSSRWGIASSSSHCLQEAVKNHSLKGIYQEMAHRNTTLEFMKRNHLMGK